MFLYLQGKRWRFLRRFHVWVGLVASLPWALQGLTGALLVFEQELDAVLNQDLFYVEPKGERLSIDEQFAVVRREQPEVAPTVYGIDVSNRPGHATQMLAKPEGEVGPKDGVRLFVDPYRGTLLGLQSYQDSLMGKVYHFHRTFYLERWGRWITSTSGLLLAASVLVGVFIIRRKPGGRFYHWHNRFGILFAPLVFIVALNGVIVTYRFVVFPLIYVATGDDIPEGIVAPLRLEPPDGAKRIGLDHAVRIAEQAVPAAASTVLLDPVRRDRPMVVMRRKPHEPRDVGGTFVTIQPYTGVVIDITDFTDGSLGNQLVYVTEHLHQGQWGGYFGEQFKLVTRILWCITALSIPVLAALGWLSMWRGSSPRHDAEGIATPSTASIDNSASGGSLVSASCRREK